MTTTYWLVGRRIVEQEQQGVARAAYGEQLLKRLSRDLSKRFGRGFSERNLEQMRGFYLGWPISQAAPAESSPLSRGPQFSQTASAKYRTTLPDEQTIAAELERTRAALEKRASSREPVRKKRRKASDREP